MPGKCLSYPVAHQYARQTHPAPVDAPDEPDTVMFYDMIDYSCLNGWSMHGNFDIIFGPFLALFSAPSHPARAVRHALLGPYADLVLIGAWNPML